MNGGHLNYFLRKEEQLIALEIQNNFLSQERELQPISLKELHLINANLLLTDNTNTAFKVHGQIINSLITSYINSKFKQHSIDLKEVFRFEQIDLLENLVANNIDAIPEIIEELHINFLNSEFSISNGGLNRKKSKHHLRENGAVYTLKQITKEIVDNTISKVIQKQPVANAMTYLDFACGTGRFYFEAVKTLNEKYALPLNKIITNNLFAIDLDEIALNILRCKVISLFPKLDSEIIGALSTNILNRNALMPKATLLHDDKMGIDFSKDFKSAFYGGGFDVVFSNPPYRLLKVNKKENAEKLNGYYTNLQNKIQKELNFFRTSGIYQHSIEGMLNYYQLSIEMILRLTKIGGQIGIICPSSLFADLTSAKLRKHIMGSHKLHFIRYYPESAMLFENIAQSTVIFYLQKGGSTDKIEIEIPDKKFDINLAIIKNIFPTNYEIPLIDKAGWVILEKISKYRKLKEIPFIRNRRGEMDLTFYKSFITSENTGWRLVRGNMISDKCLVDSNQEFVLIEEFLNRKSDDFKMYDYNRERLVCQQISNVDIYRRLKFIFCEKTDILGNSCNYIVSTRNQNDLKKLNYILNSSLLNWRFKITSSNNHINNYELDELPIADLDSFELNKFSKNEKGNDEVVCKLYGLTPTEIGYIMNAKRKLETVFDNEYETV